MATVSELTIEIEDLKTEYELLKRHLESDGLLDEDDQRELSNIQGIIDIVQMEISNQENYPESDNTEIETMELHPTSDNSSIDSTEQYPESDNSAEDVTAIESTSEREEEESSTVDWVKNIVQETLTDTHNFRLEIPVGNEKLLLEGYVKFDFGAVSCVEAMVHLYYEGKAIEQTGAFPDFQPLDIQVSTDGNKFSLDQLGFKLGDVAVAINETGAYAGFSKAGVTINAGLEDNLLILKPKMDVLGVLFGSVIADAVKAWSKDMGNNFNPEFTAELPFEGEIHIKLQPMSMRLEKMSFTPSINFTLNTEGMGGLSVDVGGSMDLESDYAEGVAGDTVSTTTGNAEAHLTVAMFDQELSLSVERSASNSDWLYEVKKEGDELLLEALRKTYRQLSSETNIDSNFNIYRYVDRFDQIFEEQWEEGKARIKERENLTVKDELVDLTFYQRTGGIYEIATQASIINSVVGSCKICKGVHELILFDQNKVFLDGVYESTAGTWSASIEMKQSGNKITGKYSKGSLEGTVSAIRIAGTWEENGSTGKFQFQIQENGQVLDGTYSTDGSSDTKPWIMTRK